MASRGMSLVYQLGYEETRKQLVGALVGTLSGTAPRKRRAVKVEGDSKVFEDGTMGPTPDGKGLSTYQVCFFNGRVRLGQLRVASWSSCADA